MIDLDQTTLTTLSLLESRLLRIEHLLHGPSPPPNPPPRSEPAVHRITNLERRFSKLLSSIRVYSDLIKIYKSAPDLFHAAPASLPPTQLPPASLLSIVLSAAPSLPAAQSALSAIHDLPIPPPDASARLASLSPRLAALQAVQLSQAAELARLRARSEALVREWYERAAVEGAAGLAEVVARVQGVERGLRREERRVERENEL